MNSRRYALYAGPSQRGHYHPGSLLAHLAAVLAEYGTVVQTPRFDF